MRLEASQGRVRLSADTHADALREASHMPRDGKRRKRMGRACREREEANGRRRRGRREGGGARTAASSNTALTAAELLK